MVVMGPAVRRDDSELRGTAIRRSASLHSRAGRGFAIAMTLDTPLVQAEPIARAPSARWRRFARPALGLLLPLTLAVGWEIAVRSGWSNGRLVPPPSRI